ATVYVMPDPTTGGKAVLAPPDLLEALRFASHQAEPASGAMLTEARYEGTAAGAEMRWKARFGVVNFRDAGAIAAVALPEVQPLSAELDGHVVLPRAGGEGGRFEFDLAGRGAHTLVLRFTTAVSA